MSTNGFVSSNNVLKNKITTPIRPWVARWSGNWELPICQTVILRLSDSGCAIFFLLSIPHTLENHHQLRTQWAKVLTAPPTRNILCPLCYIRLPFLTCNKQQQPKRFLLVVGCMFVPVRQLARFSRGRGWNCRLWYDDRRRIDGHTSVRLYMDPKNTTGLSSKRSVQTAGFSQSEKRYYYLDEPKTENIWRDD